MSRTEFASEKWMVAVGVTDMGDGPTAFMQIWEQPFSRQDGCLLEFNGFGAHYNGNVDKLPIEAKQLVRETERAYLRARREGNHQPNLDAQRIERICACLGMAGDGLGLEISKALDR